jgi:MFS family permease
MRVADNIELPVAAVQPAPSINGALASLALCMLLPALATTTLVVGVGRLGDIMGRRRWFIAGIVLFTVSSLLCGAASQLGLLIAARVAQGLGASVMMATLVVGPFYLARALGLAAAQVGLVLSAGPQAAALAGVPAGRWVDRFGAERIARIGLVQIAAGAGPARQSAPGASGGAPPQPVAKHAGQGRPQA